MKTTTETRHQGLAEVFMVHDTQRVESIRARAAVQLQLVSTLEAKIKKGTLPQLQLARKQLRDIEDFFLANLGEESRTPREEAIWLDGAEHMLQAWTAEVKNVDEQFRKFGPGQVDIIGW